MQVFDNIITDRGSRYAVSGGACETAADAQLFVDILCEQKKFAKATHNTWALLTQQGGMKDDDGEDGAGILIVRMLEREALYNHVIVVTRWYGGKQLGGARFRHVQNAVRHYLTHYTD